MDLSGSRLIPAPLAAVRAALQDPEILKACIPGCERLERSREGAYDGAVAAKVGPIRAALAGAARISEVSPDGWSIEAEAADPAAGSGKGRGRVSLAGQEGGALLSYEGTAEVEGKIGQLGSRLLTGVTRQAIEGFLTNLAELAAAGRLPGAEAATPAAADRAVAPAPEPEPAVVEAPPLVHEELDPAPTLKAPPIAGAPLEPAPIAPTAVPDVPDPLAISAAEVVEASNEGGGGSVGRIMLVAAIVVAVGVAIYFGFLQRPPTPPA